MSHSKPILKRIFIHFQLGLFLVFLCAGNAAARSSLRQDRPRIVVTADPELDDNNSLIRFLLYSSDFDVEGLIYASSQFHWKGDGKVFFEEWLNNLNCKSLL